MEILKRESTKRLFLAFEIAAPWPEKHPKARFLREQDRHITLVFLGDVAWEPMPQRLDKMPKPTFHLSPAGICDNFLFLPPRHPRVVSYHIFWKTAGEALASYQDEVSSWFSEKGYKINKRSFLPHVTIGRSPFAVSAWKKHFQALPCIAKNLHLYESFEHLHYKPIWTFPMVAPFEQIDHTADLAFRIRGNTLRDLLIHSILALAFHDPTILEIDFPKESPDSLDEIIALLNRVISESHDKFAYKFKGIFHHGEIKKRKDNLLEWEMSVDL